jgi:exosome complex component CSL4
MSGTEAGRLVLPGELLGTAEEFVPGMGTYEDGGRIYAALLGHSKVDPADHAVRVEALHAVPRLKENDHVYARVEELKSAMAVVTVLADADGGRLVPGAPDGTIHISKAKDGYTETLADEFAPGDIVVAQVLQSHPTVKLSTAPMALGVVAARCQACHALLELRGKELACPRCGRHEHRKVSESYGRGFIVPEPAAPRPDAPVD